MDPKNIISDALDQLKQILPHTKEILCQDVPGLVEACLQRTLKKMNIVTNEEFETQKIILKRMQDKIAFLEDKLRDLSSL